MAHCRRLSLFRCVEQPAFEAAEIARRGKEAETAAVADDDSCDSFAGFDDV
jgi:hypothetical protein